MLNVQFQHSATSETVNAILPIEFTREQFAKAASDKLNTNINGYRFYVNSEQLDIESDAAFNQKKHLIENGSIVLAVYRLEGGASTQVNMLHKNLLNLVPGEVDKVAKPGASCDVCAETKPCLTICHTTMCVSCFNQYFSSNNLQAKCCICSNTVPYDRIFAPGQLLNNLQSLDRLKTFVANIDCQVCSCGALAINETLYPKQKCIKCQRTYCFFCNKNWDERTMANVSKYTCFNNCFYETLITYKMMPFHYTTQFQIPNRRCCPSCLTLGAYDGKCKYHRCSICKAQFCFICLENVQVCAAKYKKSYREKCTDYKQQTYSIFPRLNKTSN